MREKEVTQHGIQQEHQIHRCQIDIRGIGAANQPWQEGNHRAARAKDHRAHDVIDPAVVIQQGIDGLPVIRRDGPVHMHHDGAAETQLGHIEHRQNGAEQTVQSQILRAQQPDKQASGQEGKDHQDQPAEVAVGSIACGIFGSFQFHEWVPL